MKSYPRIMKTIALSALLMIAFAGISGAEDDNRPSGSGFAAMPLALTLSQPTRGVVFYTAAINSDGSVASCFGCNKLKTVRLGVGTYQVSFGGNVQAVYGFSRWVQPDTLTTGTENAWCNTADRAGDVTSVWVNCQTAGGAGSMGNSKPVDTSFFLFVAR